MSADVDVRALLREIAQLPSPVKPATLQINGNPAGYACEWCRASWALNRTGDERHEPTCLWPRAQAALTQGVTPTGGATGEGQHSSELENAAREIVRRFKDDEAKGFRSKDRAYVIEVLEWTLKNYPASAPATVPMVGTCGTCRFNQGYDANGLVCNQPDMVAVSFSSAYFHAPVENFGCTLHEPHAAGPHEGTET